MAPPDTILHRTRETAGDKDGTTDVHKAKKSTHGGWKGKQVDLPKT